MFGFHAEKLVKEGKWDKLETVAGKGDEEKDLKIVAACAGSQEDGAYNLLISILDSGSEKCKLAAVKALGEQGRASAATHLMHLRDTHGDNAEMMQALDEALENIHKHGHQ